MTYQQTLDWLFSQLPVYQRVGQGAYKADLKNTQLLMSLLNHPEKQFKAIHVAGTNGKGSVAHMLAAIFQKMGYKTGLYTSPHLKDFKERIKINGQMIAKDEVVDFVELYKEDFSRIGLSFFEMTVGMAFRYFARQKVDMTIIEVGMGGRLDSTNVITPELSVITNISLDHTQFLGNNLAAIAREKAGIIKPHVPVVIGEVLSETRPVFEAVAKEKNAPLFYTSELNPEWLSNLNSPYQAKNIATIQKCVSVLERLNYPASAHTKDAIREVKSLTGLYGRWEVLREKPRVIVDIVHNEAGIKLAIKQIQKEDYNNLHIIWGMVDDKNIETILRLLPVKAQYYFCRPDIPRGKDAEIICRESHALNMSGKSYKSVQAALQAAIAKAHPDDLIFLGGSTFVVAEVL